jgi:lysophospholipase L1-like esterase
VSARPEQPETFLRGCLFGPVAGIPYPRANPSDADRLPVDVWAAAQLPAGVRLEMVGDAQAVQISYETTSGNLGYRGEGAGCTFSLYRHAQKLSEEEAVLGQGIVELELSGDPDRAAVVYLPEGMRPVITSVTGLGGTLEPAPTQPRWLAYGDAATQGWLASSPSLSWPAVAGRKLGFDVVNLGYAGSARGDTSLAEMLADTPAEAISIAIGSNAWSRIPHTADLMAEEIRAFISLVRSGQPSTPIVVVSPTLRPDAEDKPNRLGATMADLRIAMEEAVRERMAGGDARLFLVEGARVLEEDDLEDGVYPGDEGHKRLAAAVSKYLSPIMNELREAALARWSDENFVGGDDHGPVFVSAVSAPSAGIVDSQTQAMVDDVFAEATVGAPAATVAVGSAAEFTATTAPAAETAVPVMDTAGAAAVGADPTVPTSAPAAPVPTLDTPTPVVVVPSMAGRHDALSEEVIVPAASTGQVAAAIAEAEPTPRIRVTVPQGLVEQLGESRLTESPGTAVDPRGVPVAAAPQLPVAAATQQPVAGVKYHDAASYRSGDPGGYAGPVYLPGSVVPGAGGAVEAGSPLTMPAQAGGAEIQPVHAEMAVTEPSAAVTPPSADGPGFVVPQG